MNTRSPSPAVARALLSAELKKLRAASNETQEAVALACEMSVAKFSRMENATSPVSKGDLLLVLRHYGADDARIDMLSQLAREARSHGWWQRYDFGSDKGFEAYLGYEDGASSIRTSQPHVIPGLLQTPKYTRQVMEAWGFSEEAIQRGIAIREERQDRVAVRGTEQIFIIDEEVISRPVTDRPVGDAMPDQLRHLLTVAGKPAVTIRIIPRSRGHHFGMRGPFVLLSFQGELDDVLYIESARRGDLLIAEDREQLGGPSTPKFENPAEVVAQFQDGFKRLMEISLPPEESLALIEGSIRDPAA
jgi:transcriptional regulator with XRE-family HTH domain